MELTISNRLKLGKAVGALRKEGHIPAVLYGHGLETRSIMVNRKEFEKVFKEAGENTIINLVLDANEKHPALVHEVQRDFISGVVNHIDFYEVRMDEKISAPIPIEIIGESPAVKNLEGVLNHSMDSMEVEALPKDLPQHFTIDISVLVELNQSIYVKDIVVPSGVKVLVDPETVVVTVNEPRKEEELAPVEPADVSEVKVESEEKKEERAKEKEENKEE